MFEELKVIKSERNKAMLCTLPYTPKLPRIARPSCRLDPSFDKLNFPLAFQSEVSPCPNPLLR